MPWPEVVAKDVQFLVSSILLRTKYKGKLPSLVCYPQFPSKKTSIYKISSALGLRLTNKEIAHPKLVLFFEDATAKESAEAQYIRNQKHVLNHKCVDISKVKVDREHLKAFGYNTFIDPFTFEGIAVVKSDENAMHDGVKITCPINSKEVGKIYQILIDNSFNSTHVVDIRVPVFRGKIPLVYLKYKTNEKRFTNEVDYTELKTTEEALTIEECRAIAAFCEGMSVDFAELDVLRHNATGKIYVIDVNNTPYGPPSGMKANESKRAVEILSKAFNKEFLLPLAQ